MDEIESHLAYAEELECEFLRVIGLTITQEKRDNLYGVVGHIQKISRDLKMMLQDRDPDDVAMLPSTSGQTDDDSVAPNKRPTNAVAPKIRCLDVFDRRGPYIGQRSGPIHASPPEKGTTSLSAHPALLAGKSNEDTSVNTLGRHKLTSQVSVSNSSPKSGRSTEASALRQRNSSEGDANASHHESSDVSVTKPPRVNIKRFSVGRSCQAPVSTDLKKAASANRLYGDMVTGEGMKEKPEVSRSVGVGGYELEREKGDRKTKERPMVVAPSEAEQLGPSMVNARDSLMLQRTQLIATGKPGQGVTIGGPDNHAHKVSVLGSQSEPLDIRFQSPSRGSARIEPCASGSLTETSIRSDGQLGSRLVDMGRSSLYERGGLNTASGLQRTPESRLRRNPVKMQPQHQREACRQLAHDPYASTLSSRNRRTQSAERGLTTVENVVNEVAFGGVYHGGPEVSLYARGAGQSDMIFNTDDELLITPVRSMSFESGYGKPVSWGGDDFVSNGPSSSRALAPGSQRGLVEILSRNDSAVAEKKFRPNDNLVPDGGSQNFEAASRRSCRMDSGDMRVAQYFVNPNDYMSNVTDGSTYEGSGNSYNCVDNAVGAFSDIPGSAGDNTFTISNTSSHSSDTKTITSILPQCSNNNYFVQGSSQCASTTHSTGVATSGYSAQMNDVLAYTTGTNRLPGASQIPEPQAASSSLQSDDIGAYIQHHDDPADELAEEGDDCASVAGTDIVTRVFGEELLASLNTSTTTASDDPPTDTIPLSTAFLPFAITSNFLSTAAGGGGGNRPGHLPLALTDADILCGIRDDLSATLTSGWTADSPVKPLLPGVPLRRRKLISGDEIARVLSGERIEKLIADIRIDESPPFDLWDEVDVEAPFRSETRSALPPPFGGRKAAPPVVRRQRRNGAGKKDLKKLSATSVEKQLATRQNLTGDIGYRIYYPELDKVHQKKRDYMVIAPIAPASTKVVIMTMKWQPDPNAEQDEHGQEGSGIEGPGRPKNTAEGSGDGVPHRNGGGRSGSFGSTEDVASVDDPNDTFEGDCFDEQDDEADPFEALDPMPKPRQELKAPRFRGKFKKPTGAGDNFLRARSISYSRAVKQKRFVFSKFDRKRRYCGFLASNLSRRIAEKDQVDAEDVDSDDDFETFSPEKYERLVASDI